MRSRSAPCFAHPMRFLPSHSVPASHLARGQLHPRAVWLYNALHSLVGPIGLELLVQPVLIGSGLVRRHAGLGHPHRQRSRARLRTAHPQGIQYA
jgi:hypothetical protein